jgi:muramoyltetrapeptide carboxypeptidase
MTDARLPLADRKVRIVAPAKWAPAEIVERFGARLTALGATVGVDPQVFDRHGQLAGDDETRARALIAALESPDIDVVWAVRGGYGALRLLSRLDFGAARARVFAGYSDHTAIHQALLGSPVAAAHCAMPFDLRKPEGAANVEAAARLIGTLLETGRPPQRRYGLTPLRAGTVAAPLIPANLAVLTRLIGTPYEPTWERAILCLEDVDEYLYAIDRMVWHIAASKLGQRIEGVIVGDFTGTLDNETPWGESVAQIVARNFPGVPAAAGLRIGHDAVNVPLVVGEPAMLSVDGAGATLTLGGGGS